MYNFRESYEEMFENIVGGTCDYLHDHKLKSMILGVSGGIDSALVAAIAREVCARMDNSVKLIGTDISIGRDEGIDRATLVGRAFCHEFKTLNYTELWQQVQRVVEQYDDVVPESSREIAISRGNMKARIRMIKLYDLAYRYRGIVLSTDNYTEYLLGFWTLHGDVGDFGTIQNLWKTEVYGMAAFLRDRFDKHGAYVEVEALSTCIDAMPTDGLGITDSDFDQICPEEAETGSPSEVYHKVDTLLYDYLRERKNVGNEVIVRHDATHFKRENPFNLPREEIIRKGINS